MIIIKKPFFLQGISYIYISLYEAWERERERVREKEWSEICWMLVRINVCWQIHFNRAVGGVGRKGSDFLREDWIQCHHRISHKGLCDNLSTLLAVLCQPFISFFCVCFCLFFCFSHLIMVSTKILSAENRAVRQSRCLFFVQHVWVLGSMGHLPGREARDVHLPIPCTDALKLWVFKNCRGKIEINKYWNRNDCWH